MKPIRVLLSLIIGVVVLFASNLSVQAIGFEAETVYESVFVIYSGNALGSGFAISENCIVTNAHVITQKQDITVVTYGNEKYKASVADINENEDIAVLYVKNAKFPFLTVADHTSMKTGDDIYAIGAPKGMTYTLTKGGISAKERIIGKYSYIQIDAAINEGNSGGPLLNDSGQVLGMNTLKMSDSEGIGIAIPINRICNYLNILDISIGATRYAGNAGDVQEETPSTDSSNNKKTENDRPKEVGTTPVITFIAIGVTGISLIGNIILIILLIYQKKKNLTLKFDPSERTDFEIDLLE